MQLDDKTWIVNSAMDLIAFPAHIIELFKVNKYITFTWRFGPDRSLDSNALLHVWLTEYAAHLLNKSKKQVTEAEIEGIKKIAKRKYYSETGAEWMVVKPVDPWTGEEGTPVLRSSKNYKRGEMFLFLTWLQMTAANDGLVLESLGEYARLQRKQAA
jgi:hypothetical protein